MFVMNRILFLLLLVCSCAFGMERAQGDCMKGAARVVTNGANSTTRVMQSYVNLNGTTPVSGCTVSVYITASGGTLASLYSTSTGTPLANPFIADSSGHWFFYAVNGTYDVTMSGAGIAAPFTLGSVPVFDPTDAGLWSVKSAPYYCVGDGIADDTACVSAAVSSNNPIYFPDGTYKVHNNPNPLSFTTWLGSMKMSHAASILCDNPHQGCFLFTGGSNNILEDVTYTYGNTEPTDQCPDHGGAGNCWGWAFYGTQNTTVRNFNVNNGYGIGLLFIGGCANAGASGCGHLSEPTLHCVHPQIIGARITNISRDGLNIQNCSAAVVSDVYGENTGDDTFGFQYSTDRWQDTGMVATNLYSYQSLGSCISDSQQNVAITNVICDGPSTGGFLISYPGFILNSFSGTISHAVIRNVAFRTGGICNCGQRGIDFFNGKEFVSFDDIVIENTNGSGILMETFDETPPIVPIINFSNIRVHNAGVNGNTDGAGHCGLFQAATTVTVSNFWANGCAGWGASFDNITTLNVSGLQVTNADTGLVSYVGNQAVAFSGNGTIQASNIEISDLQGSATGYVVSEAGTSGTSIINGVQSYIKNGTFAFNVSGSTKFWNVMDRTTGVNMTNASMSGYGGAPLPFTSYITVSDPTAANLIAASSGAASPNGAAITINNGSAHQQSAYGMLDQGTLWWSLVKGKDNEMIPHYFAVFDALNNLDAILINPNSPVSGYKERIQLGPSGTSLVWAILPVFASNAAAISGGLGPGDFFKDASGNVHVTQ